MGFIGYVVLELLGFLRSLFPFPVQKLIMRIELPFAQSVFWQACGIDDAVSSFMERHSRAYSFALLNMLYRSAPDSDQESDALLFLLSVLNVQEVRDKMREYAETRASDQVRIEIEELLTKSLTW